MPAHSSRELFIAKQDPLVPSAAGLEEKPQQLHCRCPKN
jgi:hypothetical protein